ncbi:hypothetical protein COO60DRAFT_1513500 [Scenedesmus sp. NREL 46B-D3]|nr:hypothetical protein COO60DRAFT_1513500 [Scenedesmus sp. NREL 46B-D3]
MPVNKLIAVFCSSVAGIAAAVHDVQLPTCLCQLPGRLLSAMDAGVPAVSILFFPLIFSWC